MLGKKEGKKEVVGIYFQYTYGGGSPDNNQKKEVLRW